MGHDSGLFLRKPVKDVARLMVGRIGDYVVLIAYVLLGCSLSRQFKEHAGPEGTVGKRASYTAWDGKDFNITIRRQPDLVSYHE
jgi:hypothetical protein